MYYFKLVRRTRRREMGAQAWPTSCGPVFAKATPRPTDAASASSGAEYTSASFCEMQVP